MSSLPRLWRGRRHSNMIDRVCAAHHPLSMLAHSQQLKGGSFEHFED